MRNNGCSRTHHSSTLPTTLASTTRRIGCGMMGSEPPLEASAARRHPRAVFFLITSLAAILEPEEGKHLSGGSRSEGPAEAERRGGRDGAGGFCLQAITRSRGCPGAPGDARELPKPNLAAAACGAHDAMTSGLFTRLTFKVSVETEFGDAVFVTGNAPILGEMSPGPRAPIVPCWCGPLPNVQCSVGQPCPAGGLESRLCTLSTVQLRLDQFCVGCAAWVFARPHLALAARTKDYWSWP